VISKEDIKRSVLTTSVAVSKEIVVNVLEELKRKKLEDIVRANFGFYDIHDLLYALEILNEEKKPETIVFESGARIKLAPEVQPKPALESPRKQAVHKGGKKSVSR